MIVVFPTVFIPLIQLFAATVIILDPAIVKHEKKNSMSFSLKSGKVQIVRLQKRGRIYEMLSIGVAALLSVLFMAAIGAILAIVISAKNNFTENIRRVNLLQI